MLYELPYQGRDSVHSLVIAVDGKAAGGEWAQLFGNPAADAGKFALEIAVALRVAQLVNHGLSPIRIA